MAPLVLKSKDPTEFLQYVLKASSPHSTLIVCCTREEFIEHALQAIRTTESTTSKITGAANATPRSARTTSTSPIAEKPDLLMPTLSLLSLSTAINVVFCPSLQHLRAYLSTFEVTLAQEPGSLSGRGDASSEGHAKDSKPAQTSLLTLYNPITLHRSTSEFSAQGISRTLATAVEAANRCALRLILADCGDYEADGFGEDEDRQLSEDVPMPDANAGFGDDGQTRQRGTIWDEEVPILSSTVSFRNAGVGASDDRGWSGRKVTVRRVLSRWCVFEKGEESTNMLGAG